MCFPSMSMPPRSTSSRPSRSFSAKKVTGVRTANYFGKARQERRATRGGIGRTNHWKKAIVRLKEGEKLDLA